MTQVAAIVQRFGLNLVGATPAGAYDALVPPPYRLAARAGVTAIVIGHGGGAFWEAYRRHAVAHPDAVARADPLDDYTRAIMETQVLPGLTALGLAPTLRLPFRDERPPLSFVHLAEAAGLGRRSLLGVLIHPEFGPWIALRGAVLVEAAVGARRPAAGFDPCGTCTERPCVAACPAGAIGPAGWDVPACVDHRVADPDVCRAHCEARVACVYGRAHRYPSEARRYHQARAFAVMRAGRSAHS